MTFSRPVDKKFGIGAEYGAPGLRWDEQIDPETGLWGPRMHGHGHHHGTDFECPEGTPVMAMADGVIVRAAHASVEDPQPGAGYNVIQLVMMPGFDSWWMRYSHLQGTNPEIRLGQQVKAGDVIGYSGIGEAGRAYLHVDLMDPKHQYRRIDFSTVER